MSNNIENTKRAYAAFGSGDMTTLTDLIAPDCVWHVGGRSQLAGDYVGHEQIFGYFGKLYELTDGTFSATLDDVGQTESGLVTCIVTLRGSRNGKSITTRMVEIGLANAAGQVAECWWYAEDAYAADEFFGPAEIVLPAQSTRTPSPV
jgi:ketosteroid isomerase-like protein